MTKLKAGTKLSFKSKLENWAEGMDYCAVAVPAAITKKLGTTAAVMVMAQLNGSAPFKVSLFPAGGGQHYIRIRKKVREAEQLKQGDAVKVGIVIVDRADIKIPKDLADALRADGMTADFNAMTAGKKNFILRKIDDALKPETRAKRVAEAVEEAHRSSEKKPRKR